jgi:hypothetical protein
MNRSSSHNNTPLRRSKSTLPRLPRKKTVPSSPLRWTVKDDQALKGAMVAVRNPRSDKGEGF